MARIVPFQPYRYTSRAGEIGRLLTQPYDKISPEMQARYLASSQYNYAHLILGARGPSDSESDNVYTRAAATLRDWIGGEIMAPDAEPGFYPYFQEFAVPDSGERAVRKGFIALGPAAEYSEGVVFRHEQTLSGPKKDRLELLRHTGAQTGQLFFLYSDPELVVDAILDEAAAAEPLVEVTDEYDVVHRLWRIAEPARLREISRLMDDKKLLIADGHHRYETALAYRRENPDLPGARHVMMTLVNMDSSGLKILATHRLVHALEGFDTSALVAGAGKRFEVTPAGSEEALAEALSETPPERIRIGLATGGGGQLFVLERERAPGELDVVALHEELLGAVLGIGEESVREQRNLRYIRGAGAAVAEVRRGAAQAAFLLNPTSMRQVAEVSFSGGVMPQKSTDFYPKLLSGLTTYRMK